MVVLSITDCPPKLRGDLSKWLLEINTGVFVGRLSARVRDALWDRVCENLRSGRATIVFGASCEQQMDFRTHNTTWEPVDYDGIKLIRRPSPKRLGEKTSCTLDSGYSKANQIQKLKNIERARLKKSISDDYTVVDIETSGLSPEKHEIVELAALRIRNGEIADSFNILLKPQALVSAELTALTGLDDELLQRDGKQLSVALDFFTAFVGQDRIVCHNAAFDHSFLRKAYKSVSREMLMNRFADTLPLARRKLTGLENYKLTTIAEYFSLNVTNAHRALADCILTFEVYRKLKEM